MSHVVHSMLALVGSLCATLSLASGEAIRGDGEPASRRLTPRMLLALVCLGVALVGSATDVLRSPGAAVPFAWTSLLLLAAGVVTTWWAFVAGPRRRGDESLGERITRRGKVALGLLAASQVLDLLTGPALTEIAQLRGQGSGTAPILGVLGLFLVALGTGAAAATFHSRAALLPEPGPVLKRLSPLAKGTFIILGLGLAVVGVAALLTPENNLFLCVVLLTLGIGTGLVESFSGRRSDGHPEAGPWGISARGWVSLALLGLAAAGLGAPQMRLLSGTSSPSVADSGKPRTEPAAALRSESVVQSPWQRKADSPGSADVSDSSTEARMRKELREAKEKVDALEAALRGGKAETRDPPRPVNAEREPAAKNNRPESVATSPVVVDMSGWRHR